jgi:hypothetical protein
MVVQGTYQGLGYSFEIKGNFMPEDEFPGVTHYKYYLFVNFIQERLRDSFAGIRHKRHFNKNREANVPSFSSRQLLATVLVLQKMNYCPGPILRDENGNRVRIPDGPATVSGECLPICHWAYAREGGKYAMSHKSGYLPG